MPIRIFTLIACLSLISATLDAQELKLKKGQEFIFEKEQSVAFPNGSTDSYQVYAFEVKGKDPSGNYRLETELRDARQKSQSGGRTFVFNSDSVRITSFNTTTSLDQLAILRRPFAVTVSPEGEVIESNAAELAKEAAKKWELKQDIADRLIQNAEAITKSMQAFFIRLPEDKRLKEGIEWTNSGDTTRFRVGAAGDDYTIIPSGGGRIQLERNSLLPISYTHEFDTPVGTENLRAKGSTRISRLEEHRENSPLDTAWVNMAVSSSYWSEKLLSKEEYDSLKVMRFIEKYGKLYPDDPVYVDNALKALQQTDNYEEYDRMLTATPNSLLINSSSHLHNKLQRVSDSDPEAAFELIKIMNERYPGSLYGWIQHSFSQAFRGDDGTERRKAANELLALCAGSSDESVRHQFAALNVWVNAKAPVKEEAEKATALEQAFSAIRQMDASYWRESNLGRYALLVTQLFGEAENASRAGELLDYSLDRLEKAVDDSLNNHRLDHRNMLAHAYFMKYQRTLPSDSAAALGYLQRAADLSPKSSAEKSHGSFYDRAFLQSKESYQADYMATLSRLGRMDDALDAVVAEFNADPLVLPKLKDYYERTFPDKNFADFFAKEVVSNWNEAPAFSLPNLDDQPVSLEDYTGKWLVIDFWGTWCGPCKEEMPQINAFYQRLGKGAIPGVDFLSIACYDTKEKVVDYLAVNNFKLPALVSDGKVQKSYQIKGYPTKILVSPDGKMKMLRFGAKWETIIEQIAEVYSGTIKNKI